MSLEQNKAIVLKFYKAFAQGNLEQMKEMTTPNFVVHDHGPDVLSSDDFFKRLQMTRSTFQDSYHTIEDVIAEDDKVVIRGTFTGTHSQEFLGIPPTGKQVIFPVIQAGRLADGKIVELWMPGLPLDILQQLRGEYLV
jgi:steroid delta-isomerase-like uncharacterized protein